MKQILEDHLSTVCKLILSESYTTVTFRANTSNRTARNNKCNSVLKHGLMLKPPTQICIGLSVMTSRWYSGQHLAVNERLNKCLVTSVIISCWKDRRKTVGWRAEWVSDTPDFIANSETTGELLQKRNDKWIKLLKRDLDLGLLLYCFQHVH